MKIINFLPKYNVSHPQLSCDNNNDDNNNDENLPKSILVSNRGEIARRVFMTCKRLNIRCIAVYTKNDITSNHPKFADEAYEINSYLDGNNIIDICLKYNIDAIHPGYGFLSENSEFVEQVEENNIIWLGPSSNAMQTFALKHSARIFAQKANVPIVPGSNVLENINDAIKVANDIKYPIILKATAGGGGIGMYLCRNDNELKVQYDNASRQALSFFNDNRLYMEKYVDKPRHIEVQVFGDGLGNVVHFNERECSVQRRHQKVVEEAPSPLVDPDLRKALTSAATRLASAVNYNSAGTVEFLVDGNTKQFYFLEMNTRLQVEHGITELIHSTKDHGSLDIVELMIRQGNGKTHCLNLELFKNFPMQGHSIEVRLYAEDPYKNFQPAPGILTDVSFPSYARCDTVVKTGSKITPFFDPLVAKLMVYGKNREESLKKMSHALHNSRLKGTRTNLNYLCDVIDHPEFHDGDYTTHFLDKLKSNNQRGMTVKKPGLYTTVQDTGRYGYWRIGVPPSGAVDTLSFRIANKLVGNEPNSAGIEITYQGAEFIFNENVAIALCGGEFPLFINDKPVGLWQNHKINKGDKVTILSNSRGAGQRCYLCISDGGIDVPLYLGSRSTFPGGKMGGFQGRTLRAGDNLDLFTNNNENSFYNNFIKYYCPLNAPISNNWIIRVVRGPQESPDYLLEKSMQKFLNTVWKVHYNSNRFGIRLIGPKLDWARNNGGDGGSHPSNVLDNEYRVGTINITGDMPIILSVDGPSLGGFVCAVTIIEADLWKMGQLKSNDSIHFDVVTIQDALSLQSIQEELISNIGKKSSVILPKPINEVYDRAILYQDENMFVRMQGSDSLLIEYGDPQKLDLNNRFRVYGLELELQKMKVNGIQEFCPGVRSLQVIYDNTKINLTELLNSINIANTNMPDIDDLIIPSRILNLPIVLKDKWTKEAEEKYMKSVRQEAPYLPSNFEFVVRNNGLKDENELRNIILNASYLVLGLGDVYLGAPCALPVDPRHRIVNPKYNPARTFTADGNVGIGGSFMCIYPMASPGGYQLVGRTLPIWNSYTNNIAFDQEKPWLLRMFDQVRFYLVSEDELENNFEKFRNGLFNIRIENTKFHVREYNEFINRDEVAKETLEFQTRQAKAAAIELKAEEDYWIRQKQIENEENKIKPLVVNKEEKKKNEPSIGVGLPSALNIEYVIADMSAKMWKYTVKVGDKVKAGDCVCILESMKMEIHINTTFDGIVKELLFQVGATVEEGEQLLSIIQK